MKVVNKSLVPVLESAIRESIEIFSSGNNENFLSDLYLYYDPEEAVLTIYDDLDNELFSVQLSNYVSESDFSKQIKNAARFVLRKLNDEQYFEKDFIFKPFSASFVDKEFTVVEELIFIDNDTLKLDGELLAGLDKELDDFLRDLMK